MRAIIIEDEPLVCDYLVALIGKLNIKIEILTTLDTVTSSVLWFEQNPAPDVVFMDIRLADGLSFEIFEAVQIDCPVIFTTAYDQYAIRAFKVNSIDYLLKPVGIIPLQAAVTKLIGINNAKTSFFNTNILGSIKLDERAGYKSRFVVKLGEHLRMIPTEKVAYFMSQDKSTWLCTDEGRQYPIDQFLDTIAECVDPAQFFRINRKYLVSITSISDIVVYSGSRLKIKIAQLSNNDTIVSRERIGDFRQWLEG
jgi:DNA-binding LytR/AlgR family response regulator